MKYISIDIETSGLDPGKHEIMEFAAVLEDTEKDTTVEELPYFHAIFDHEEVLWDMKTLEFHQKLGNLIYWDYRNQDNWPGDTCWMGLRDLVEQFKMWLKDRARVGLSKHRQFEFNIAGKNPHFDLSFLNEVEDWEDDIAPHHRVLDPAILFWLPRKDGTLPNMQQCLDRANNNKWTVKHRALDDARDTIRLIRTGMRMRG